MTGLGVGKLGAGPQRGRQRRLGERGRLFAAARREQRLDRAERDRGLRALGDRRVAQQRLGRGKRGLWPALGSGEPDELGAQLVAQRAVAHA